MSAAATMDAPKKKRQRGDHGPHILSTRSQKKYIRALRDRALTGDPAAVAMLLRLAGTLPDDLDDLIVAAKVGHGTP
jgi:hypothetical protein